MCSSRLKMGICLHNLQRPNSQKWLKNVLEEVTSEGLTYITKVVT